MKTLLLLLALTIAASAQTLRWTHAAPVGAFPQDHASLTHLRGDAVGNCAYGVQYGNSNGPVGAHVVWLSAAGKTINADLITGTAFQQPRIISVSATVLLVAFVTPTVDVLRKYTRRGAIVTFKDTPLLAGEYPAVDSQEITTTDKAGFFVIVSNAAIGDFMGVKRYTVK